jgi:hypothetical protein
VREERTSVMRAAKGAVSSSERGAGAGAGEIQAKGAADTDSGAEPSLLSQISLSLHALTLFTALSTIIVASKPAVVTLTGQWRGGGAE